MYNWRRQKSLHQTLNDKQQIQMFVAFKSHNEMTVKKPSVS